MKKKSFIILFALIATMLGIMCLVVGCSKDEVEGLYKPTNIVYDGTRITWDKVTLAEYYTVQINGGEEKRVNTNLYTYDAKGEEFDVTVNSVISDKSYGNTMHFIPLDAIETITVSDSGELSWSEVVGASAYRISLNGDILPDDVTDTHYTAQAGSNRIKIRPVVSGDNSYYSAWSAEKQVFVNFAPTKIAYDGEQLSWLGNAVNYTVTLNGHTQTVSGTKLRYDSENRDFTVEVKALGDHITSFDSSSTEDSFHYLQPATGLIVDNGSLHWNEVDNAEGYQIKINGVVQNQAISATQYDNLTAGSSLAVQVKPYNNSGNYFSSWSEEKNIYILPAPTVSWNADLELDGDTNNNFVWNAVSGAVGYAVELEKDGNVTRSDYPSVQMAFGYAYSQVGVYKVRVKAVAEAGSDYYDSKYSKDITVERLAAPQASGNNYITSDPSSLASGFTVNYTSVSGATGYQMYKDGVLMDGKLSTVLALSDNDVADNSISAQQEYNYTVRSMGGVKTVSGSTHVFLPCLTDNALSFNITVQAMPTDLTMQGFSAQWSAVSGNNGYAVKYSGTVLNATATAMDLSTLHAGSYDVSVCTRGNGGATLASNYTAAINVQRLNAPTNIRISYGTGDGQLGFDNVANAKSYQVFLDQSAQALPENSFDNMYQYIQESGTVLHMVSVANYFNDLGTVYYMTSEASPTQQFIRLSAPTFPDGMFSNSVELVWNASGNINTAEYTPTYQVYESDVMQTGGVQNGTRFNIQYLDGGKSYIFRVKAVGNDSKYLDSALSVAVTVYKLNTPTLTIDKTNNAYTWSGVTNASSYVLEIDGVRVNNDIHVSGSTYSYVPNYTTIGDHSVKLYAVGDGYNNINSKAFNYTQVVKACLAPEISYGYSNEQFVNGGTIDVTITKESANANGYLYEIAGESMDSKNTTVHKSIESTGSYVIRVKAKGGLFDSDDVYYIDSQFAGGGSGYSITLLAPPTASSFSLNSDGAVKWATITGASGYDYQISYNGGEYEAMEHTGTASLDPIANFKNYKTIKIRVRAAGNGESTISSAWVEFTWTNPNK